MSKFTFSLCLYIDILGYLQNRIKLLWQLQGQIQLVEVFWGNLYLGISCILVACLLNCVHFGVMVIEDLLK